MEGVSDEIERYPLTVDYDSSFETLVAAGEYLPDADVTAEHFPIEGSGQVELEAAVINLDRETSSEGVEAEMERLGLRPARIEELLAFDAKYPDVVREVPLVALGSPWMSSKDLPFVVALWRSLGPGPPKRLGLGGNYKTPWESKTRFLAVRKEGAENVRAHKWWKFWTN